MAKIQIRRGTKAQLDTLLGTNPLSLGELGFTTDTEEVFCGDGTNHHLIGKVIVDIFTNRPAPGESGRLFHSSDTDVTYVDDGVTWVDVGSGIATLDDVDDGTTYVRVKTGAVDTGYIVQLTDNAGANPTTKVAIDDHHSDATIHFIIDDLDVTTNETWSSSKIQDEIALVVGGIVPQVAVIDQTDLTSTVTPVLGDRYINTVTGTAADGGGGVIIHNIYEWNGSTWDETVVTEGMSVWNETLDSNWVYNGTEWVKLGSTVTHNNLAGLNAPGEGYHHLTDAEYLDFTTNSHVAATVADSSTINFTINGQEISGSTVDSAINHNALLNSHNLTTDINHNLLTSYDPNRHFLQSEIDIPSTQINDFTVAVRALTTVSDTASIDMSISGGQISAILLLADGGTFV